MDYQALTDEQLVTGLRDGKIAAFDAIYARSLVSGSNQKIFNWLEIGVSEFSISYIPSS